MKSKQSRSEAKTLEQLPEDPRRALNLRAKKWGERRRNEDTVFCKKNKRSVVVSHRLLADHSHHSVDFQRL